MRDPLNWALWFFVLCIVSAVLGFTGLPGIAAEIAKVLFFVLLALLCITATLGACRGRLR